MEPGIRVSVETKNGLSFTGTVLPGNALVLKLDDGYNVGIDERNIKFLQELPAAQEKDSTAAPLVRDASLPHIRILHTGGTIASKVDYETGGVSNLFSPEELLGLYPELQKIAHVDAEFIANMSSDDMRFAHYNLLIAAVERCVDEDSLAGIIITHGTDTLHYSAAALHYALQGVPVPVVLVGSQRSADRGSTDAASNLQGAVRFITAMRTPGVFVAMHAGPGDDVVHIFRGVNVRKMHTSRRDAFKAVNVPVVARVSDTVSLVCEPPRGSVAFTPTRFRENVQVGMCYVHPQFFPEELDPYRSFDGLIIVGTGLGHLPITHADAHTRHHERVFAALAALAQKIPVVMTSQCVYGRVHLQVYSPGRRLQDAGVLGHGLALTPETAFIKLAWLLSNGMDAAEGMSQEYGDGIERIEEQTNE